MHRTRFRSNRRAVWAVMPVVAAALLATPSASAHGTSGQEGSSQFLDLGQRPGTFLSPGPAPRGPISEVPHELTPGCSLDGRDDKCEAWVSEPYDAAGLRDGPGNGGWAGRTMVTSSDGDMIFLVGHIEVGEPTEGTCDCDVVTIAYDADSGDRVWTATFPGTESHPWATPESLVLSSDGSTLFTLAVAASVDLESCVGGVTAYDAATGAERWRSLLADPGSDCTWPIAIETGPVTTPDGETNEQVYVAANSTQTSGTRRALLVVLDAGTGNTRFTASDPDATRRSATTLAVSPGGGTVYVGGHEGEHDGITVFSAMAFRSATGELLWSVHDPVTAEFNAHLGAWGIALSPDGSQMFLTGGDGISRPVPVGSGVETGLVIQAYDTSTGTPLWRQRHAPPGPLDDGLSHWMSNETVAVSPDGNRVLVTACQGYVGLSLGWTVVAFDSDTGQQAWAVNDRPPGPPLIHCGGFSPTLTMSPEGDVVFVSGPMGGSSEAQAVTAGYEVADGDPVWTARWSPGGTGTALPTSIVMDPDGSRVYVASAARLSQQVETPGDSWDIVVMAYETAPSVAASP